MFAKIKLKPLLIISFTLWYICFIYFIDFGKIYELRHIVTSIPLLSKTDPVFDEAITNINTLNLNFSKITDLFFSWAYLFPNPLPHYIIEIDNKDLSKLESAAQEALRQPSSFLTDEYNINAPAIFRADGKKYQISVRYRGDLAGHCQNYKKSWKLIFKDPPYFNQIHRLNLIIPEDPGYFRSALSKSVSRKLGLMTKEDDFVHVTLNNADQGIYYMTDDFNDDFLERYQKPPGNLYSDRFGDVPWSNNMHLTSDIGDWKKLTIDPTRSEQDFTDLYALLKLINSQPPVTLEKYTNRIDLNSFLNWQVHSILMGSQHQDNTHNAKLYSNTSTGLFEFIPNDVIFAALTLLENKDCQSLDFFYNPFVDVLLSYSEILLERNKLLWKYVSNPQNLIEELEFVKRLKNETNIAFYTGLYQSSILQMKYNTYRLTQGITERYSYIEDFFKSPIPTVQVRNAASEVNIQIVFPGGVGYSVESITLKANANTQEIKVNKDYLPHFDANKNTSRRCKTYAIDTFAKTLPCPDCQNTTVSIKMRNLTTNEYIQPIIKYEN